MLAAIHNLRIQLPPTAYRRPPVPTIKKEPTGPTTPPLKQSDEDVVPVGSWLQTAPSEAEGLRPSPLYTTAATTGVVVRLVSIAYTPQI